MYEIWLMLNIAWELLLLYGWTVLALALLWLLLLFSARRGDWSRAGRTFAVTAAITFPIALVAVPWLTRSSIGEVRYLLDWLALAGMAAGTAVVVAAFVTPLRAMLAARSCPITPRRAA